MYVAGDANRCRRGEYSAGRRKKIAGVSAAESLGLISHKDAEHQRMEIWSRLEALRMGPFGVRRQQEKENILKEYEERVGMPIPLD